MIAPCTKLDQTVNQISLSCAIGSREAIIKNTPSVAYTPKIISRYSERPPACHAQPEGQRIVSDQMPNINISPTTSKATRRYLIRSDSVMFLPPLAIQLTYWTSRMPSRDHSIKAESWKIHFSGKCDVMREENFTTP